MINKLYRGELEPNKVDYRTDPSYAKAMEELTGLTRNQYKEARKHPEVRRFFEDNVETTGSGKNVVFRRISNSPDHRAA